MQLSVTFRRLCCWLLLFLPVALVSAAPEPEFPSLTGRIVDQANVLSEPSRSSLTQLLQEHEQSSSNQVVVVTLNSLQGYAISDYGYQLGRHWNIGQQGRDNGTLLIVAPNERKVRIEVGYGLEGDLTDARAHNIIQTVILPAFRQGSFEVGIVAGTEAILGSIQGSYEAQPEKGREHDLPAEMFTLFVVLSMLGEMFGGRRGEPKRMISAAVLGGLGLVIGWLLIGSWLVGLIMGGVVSLFHYFGDTGGGHGRGGSGGHYSGRSSGGFGGGFSGGGGSFGGGGASGSW